MTLKNVPDELHEGLKRRAQAHHRSLNGEILSILENAAGLAGTRHPDAEGILRRVDALRRRIKGPGLKIEEIKTAIERGRP